MGFVLHKGFDESFTPNYKVWMRIKGASDIATASGH